jgi:hypothetical protein
MLSIIWYFALISSAHAGALLACKLEQGPMLEYNKGDFRKRSKVICNK